jgi:sulfatase maturation enzyme AslB (radical SAM superfamily)
MTWSCPFIDHAITFYPNGKVGPCCQIASDYLKPKDVINDPNRFADLKTNSPPDACKICVNNEAQNIPSYRQSGKNLGPGIAMLDIRNTNKCNLKCRYCGPHFSNKWAEELDLSETLQYSNIPSQVVTNNLTRLYFTGGEPMLNYDHWQLLQLIEKNFDPSKITIEYNTNLSITKYKQIDVEQLWSKFKKVIIKCSVDVAGPQLNYIRSGSDWKKIDQNIQKYKQLNNVYVTLNPVVSLLNIWWLDTVYDYGNNHCITVDPMVLFGPDYLALDVIPDTLQKQALDTLSKLPDSPKVEQMIGLVKNNVNKDLILHTYSHILFLDKIRNENLWSILPFTKDAKDRILKNYEYE